MPSVIALNDADQPVSVKEYPHARWPEKIKNFNIVQSRLLEVYDKEANAVIAAATSAGKTISSELFAAHELRKRGGKVIYLAPLRALAKEKIDDWTDADHHFSDLKISICTGDYRLTPERKKELEAADVILMTTEMLNSRTRNFASENNEWLKQTGVLICDEFHLLGVHGRGDHLEVGLMQFFDLAPKARLIGLSATMPNVKEIAEWVTKLTNRDTYLINSKYRPCELGIHWETYDDSNWSYDAKEEAKIAKAIEIVRNHEEDRFLLFVHTKRTGQQLLRILKQIGIQSEFHSADLDKNDRQRIENQFRTGNLRCLIATSTVAWGCNLPARRVVILGVHRGLNEVENYDIWQMAGRSGRPGFDPRGDAYILLPESHKDALTTRIKTPTNIDSRLLEYIGDAKNPHYKTLAFHLVSEIHQGGIQTAEDVRLWYRRSLAAFQAKDLDDSIITKTLDLLVKCGALFVDENQTYKATSVGKVSAMFYYSPFDAADLKKNFRFVFENKLENNDIAVSVALGAVDTHKMGFVSKAEAAEIGEYSKKVETLFGGAFNGPAIKGGFAYFALMNGLHVDAFGAMCRNLQFDFDRTSSVLQTIDALGTKWHKKDFFKQLEARIGYGVPLKLVPLCKIPGVGAKYAERLFQAGVCTASDVASNPDLVTRIIRKKKTAGEIIEAARKTALGES